MHIRRTACGTVLQSTTPGRLPRKTTRAAVLGLLVLAGACEPGPRGTRVLWQDSLSTRGPGIETTTTLLDSVWRVPRAPGSRPGSLVMVGDTSFLLPVAMAGRAGAEVHLLQFDRATSREVQDRGVRFEGVACGLVRLPDKSLLLATVEEDPAAGSHLVVRRGAADASTWAHPVAVSSRTGPLELGSSRPVATPAGLVFLAATWGESGTNPETEVVCHVSSDGGESWRETGSLRADGVQDACLALLDDGQLILVLQTRGELASSLSSDSGSTWTAPRALGLRALPFGFALVPGRVEGELALAWTDPAPDTTLALPALQALCAAVSPDGGSTWRRLRPLVLWPGRVPAAPSLWFDGRHLMAAFADVPPPWDPNPIERILCTHHERAALEAEPRYELASARFGIDPHAARTALGVLCAHTLARPPGPRRLFVEGYFMRTLAGAHALFALGGGQVVERFDAGAGLARAIDWADELVASQDSLGYWPTGYGAVYLADMAAALGLFPALEPHVEAERIQRYEAAVRRFVDAIQADGMLLPTGACGVGWWGTTVARMRQRALPKPYLVSTALAGIELRAWLYRRTGRAADREHALRSLEYTLSQIQADGSLPPGPRVPGIGTEGRFTAAAYVHEGWMAADVYLEEQAVRERLRSALRPHVDWLLGEQLPDGRWDGGATGEFARTPAIVDFLVWYDARCESRPEVRDAVRRAGLLLVDPEKWEATGLFRAGSHHEVQRALSGRSLIALARQRFVL